MGTIWKRTFRISITTSPQQMILWFHFIHNHQKIMFETQPTTTTKQNIFNRKKSYSKERLNDDLLLSEYVNDL